MSQKKAVHFGGGNIGRGFVAEKLVLSGYEVIFVDVVDAIVNELQSHKSYEVREVGDGSKVNVISNYRAINSKHDEPAVIKEIATADIVTCAVGPKILKFIAPVIAKGIMERKSDAPLSVIACENMVGGTDALAEHIGGKLDQQTKDNLKQKARFANSAIDRIVPQQPEDAGLNVTIEQFFEWCVEETAWEPEYKHPEIQAVHWVRDLAPYIERKLYTVNTSHAAAAYYGHNRGKRTIDDTMSDKELHDIVRECVEETSQLIVHSHGISEDEQRDYREKIITRISNPHLKDVVERVGRAPLRKLGRKERFVGPAAPLAEKGMKHSALLGAIEMAFRFQDVEGDDESIELAKKMREEKAEQIVQEVCGLTQDDKLYADVVKVVQKVQQG